MRIPPYIVQLLKQGREYNETSIICEQMPSILIPEVISETFCKIGLCMEGQDIFFMKKSITLREDQAEMFNQLEVGTGIMKMMSDRWFHPFLVRIPPPPPRRSVSDEEVRQRMESFFRNVKVKPRVDLLNKMISEDLEYGKIYRPDTGVREKPKPGYGINIWKEFLLIVAENPDAPKSQRQKRMGMTKWEYEKLESDLERNGLIKLHKISFGKPGDSSVYAELLPEGFGYLGVPYRPLPGKGSYAHKLAQYRLSKSMKNVSIEYRGADLVWFKAKGEKWALEIETECNDHVLTNVKRDLEESGFSRVWIMCRNEKLKEEIRYLLETKLEPELLDRVEFKLLRELI
jgi:hypothetical protein